MTIEEYKEKGVIKTQQQEEDYRRKIDVLATNNLEDLNNQKKLINKFYIKKKRVHDSIEARRLRNSKKNQKIIDQSERPTNKKIT